VGAAWKFEAMRSEEAHRDAYAYLLDGDKTYQEFRVGQAVSFAKGGRTEG